MNALKPISELSGSCLGSLKEENTIDIMEKCSHQKLSPLKTDIKRISSHKHIIFSVKEDMVFIVCVTGPHRLPKTKTKFIPANVYTELLLEDGCTGMMSGKELYPDSNFDSDENYASFNLHFEKNYLEKIPGLTDTKLTHVFTYLDKVKTEVDITQIHQISEQLDKNLQIISKMDNENSFVYSVLGAAIGSIVLTILVGGIFVFMLLRNHKSKLVQLERLLESKFAEAENRLSHKLE